MTNFIFAPIDCKVIMMAGDAPNTNLQGFYALAKIVGINFQFLLGKRIELAPCGMLHADFYIDIKLLLKQLEYIDA